MNSGVYIIHNNKNGKIYIGSTVDIRKRWRTHKSLLCRDKHSNTHLQSAWNLYGEASFEFGVLEYLDDPEELHLAEQFWMDIYRLEGKALYNYGLVARCPLLGRSPSEETRQKQSRAMRGKVFSQEHRRKLSEADIGNIYSAKPYPAFIHCETGEVIPPGINLSVVCRERNLHQGHMSAVKRGRLFQHKGWILQSGSNVKC